MWQSRNSIVLIEIETPKPMKSNNPEFEKFESYLQIKVKFDNAPAREITQHFYHSHVFVGRYIQAAVS